MYRTTLRSASRPVIASLRSSTLRAAPRRFASTATPADKSRAWKSSVARLGLAAAAVYYYNTSPVFAEEAASQKIAAPAAFSDDDLPTVDSVLEEKRKQIKKQSPEKRPTESPETGAQNTVAADGSPAALEEEAGQQGAFNPETGEINWDCPCLGGMADGPCGEEFKTAFSCFVFSNEEPKGMDCIDKFQGMQECFKKYPEIYGAELADDEDGAPTPDFGDEQPAPDAQKTSTEPIAQSTQTPPPQEVQKESPKAQPEAAPVEKKPEVEKKQEEPKVEVPRKSLESEPLQSHDATAANAEIKILEQEAARKKAEQKK
ncbi:hypothetical protein LCI18_015147 [Fusarium solani-melongenae]|uniref:Uncharacterized protein n=1 Tax=Fusarium solani subsp. cucurbitae TaxID=2747967 RepID=A0ACD3ZSU4_FUSSC|nr:hypothetical protein LCI18_015147 [Fusarium solani-melongenae]